MVAVGRGPLLWLLLRPPASPSLRQGHQSLRDPVRAGDEVPPTQGAAKERVCLALGSRLDHALAIAIQYARLLIWVMARSFG